MRLNLKSALLFALTVCLSVGLAIPVIASYKSHNNDQDSNAFLAAYPQAKGTKLDNCYLCHTGGKVSGKTKDSCDYCHSVFGYKEPHGNIMDTLNLFAKDYMINGKNQAAFSIMAQMDSDGDGYSNDVEILAGRLPGDAKDNPAVAEAPHKLYERADMRKLNILEQFMAVDTSKAGDYYTTYKGVDIWKLLQDAGVADDATSITVYAVDGYSKEFQMSELKQAYTQGTFFTKYPWISYPLNTGFSEGQTLPGELHYMMAYENDGRPLIDGKINPATNKLEGEGPYRFISPLTEPVTPDRSSWSIDRADSPAPYNYNRPITRNGDYCIKSVVAIKVNTASSNSYQYDWNGRAYEMIEKGQLVVYGALKHDATSTVTNVQANNGTLVISLSSTPSTTPILSEFTLTQSINGGPVSTIQPTTITNNGTIVTLQIPLLQATSSNQNVIDYVSYNGGTSVPSNNFSVIALDLINYPAQSNVPSDKKWTIKCNRELDLTMLLENYISITDSQDKVLSIAVTFGIDGKSIIVNPPQGGYASGGQYVLNISKGLKSKTGTLMSKSGRMQFTVK